MQPDGDLPSHKRHVQTIGVVLLISLALMYWLDISVSTKAASGAVDVDKLRWGIAKAVIENLMAGIAAAFALAVAYRAVVRLFDPVDRVVEIGASEISGRLLRNARRTWKYTFIGNTATFVSASVLPIMLARAREARRGVVISIFIIDPRDEAAVHAYVSHKNRVRLARAQNADTYSPAWVRPSGQSNAEPPETTLAKLYACIYLCAYASKASGIDMGLFMRRSFTPFRADISETEAVLTQESSSESAVAFSSHGHFYGWYMKESEALQAQCERLDLSPTGAIAQLALEHPTGSRANIKASLVTLLGIASRGKPFTPSPAVLENAVNRIIRPSHSYES